MVWKLVFAVFLAGLSIPVARAEPLAGTKTIRLHPVDGEPITVGEVTFREGTDAGYTLTYDDTLFTDHFLSMRPFKCLEGAEKLWCRVPYPYDIKREVSDADLTDLEYDLMFVWKNEGEYGIDLWNGVYYSLQAEDEKLIGVMNDFDLNELASPPEDGNLRPIAQDILEEADADSHWLPRLTIE